MLDTDPRRGKIELDVGNLHFAGEGDQDWLDQQIDKLIDAVTKGQINASAISSSEVPSISDSNPQETPVSESLASYLKAKGGDTVQTKRFLATAAWLIRRGETKLTTSAVSSALRNNQQKRLGNASDCLNQNVSRGFCEKTGNTFFITPEGWAHLGEVQA